MKLRYFTLFCWLGITSGLSMAEPCVKVRRGEADACMTFSASEKRLAAQYGLRLAAPFEASKQALLKQGWVLDKGGLADADAGLSDGQEPSCGSGWDAVCQSAFRKGDVLLSLTFSGANEGLPLVAVEVARHGPPAQSLARTLATPSFIVRIEENCPEGSVACGDVRYRGTSKKTGKSIELGGKTRRGPCADGMRACGFQGYEFWNGKTFYRVLDDGRLTVMQDNKVLLEERGSWQ